MTDRRLVTTPCSAIPPKPATLCPTCRSGLLMDKADAIRVCDDCGAVFTRNAGTGEWERLAAVYGATKFRSPTRRRPRPGNVTFR